MGKIIYPCCLGRALDADYHSPEAGRQELRHLRHHDVIHYPGTLFHYDVILYQGFLSTSQFSHTLPMYTLYFTMTSFTTKVHFLRHHDVIHYPGKLRT